MFCKFDGGRFDTGGVSDAGVESAAKPSLTIAAEKVELTAKAASFFEKALPSVPPPGSEATPTWALALLALAPFGFHNSSGIEQTSWGKLLFDHINARPAEAPLTQSDLDVIRNFWQAALQSAPEKLHPGYFLTGRPGTRIVDGVEQFSWDIDDLAIGNDAFFPNKLSDAGRNDPHAVRGVSLWTVHTFQKIYLDMLEADRLEQRIEVLRLLRTFTSLPSYPVRPEHQTAYAQAVDAVKSIRERYRNQLWRRAVQLSSVNSVGLSVDLFSEGATPETYVAPTQALVTERMVDGRSVVGTLRYVGSGESPDIELRFSAQLGVEPLVAEAVKAELSQGEQYAGQFSNWELTARPIQFQGVKASSNVQISNNTLEVTLHLDGQTGTLALWQISTDNGIPLTLDYEYRNDPTQKGKLVPIPLSLARRQHSPIEVTATGLRNKGTAPLTISYVRLPDGTLHLLQPRLVVNTGDVIAVPGIATVQLNGLTVPAEAVSVENEPYSLNDFDNADQVKLTEQIKIENVVPVTRIARPGNLQRLDLRVVYKTAVGEEQEKTISLAPNGINGSEAQLTFVRISQQGLREIWISGTAVYDNGTDTIAPRRFPAADIVIAAENLDVPTP
jgi:hypothetical protein